MEFKVWLERWGRGRDTALASAVLIDKTLESGDLGELTDYVVRTADKYIEYVKSLVAHLTREEPVTDRPGVYRFWQAQVGDYEHGEFSSAPILDFLASLRSALNDIRVTFAARYGNTPSTRQTDLAIAMTVFLNQYPAYDLRAKYEGLMRRSNAFVKSKALGRVVDWLDQMVEVAKHLRASKDAFFR